LGANLQQSSPNLIIVKIEILGGPD
jgi:hypothetical protein